jgi:PTH1 family peptidyl-tRNA hydrolase
MKVFVGLGNPGSQYRHSLHNLGFQIIDAFARKNNVKFVEKPSYAYGEFHCQDDKVFLLKPLTFMNLSGDAVSLFLRFYRIPIEDLWVILDDISLPTGSIRIRDAGSDGGHKGLRDILLKLGTDRIKRIRLGCGPLPPRFPLEQYVLMTPTSDMRKALDDQSASVLRLLDEICSGVAVHALMNQFNRVSQPHE